MSGSYLLPYQQAVQQATGLAPFAQQGQPLSWVDRILIDEANASGGAPAAIATSPQSPDAPGAPTVQSSTGGGLMGTVSEVMPYVGWANRARQLGQAGYDAYQAYQAGQAAAGAPTTAAGGLGAAAGGAAIAAVPLAATAGFTQAAQSLAKPGGQTGALVGSAGGAALGLLGGPAAPITVPLGALLGGLAGGQIGPNPSVGPNFSAVGTFNPDGTISFSGFGGDNSGTAQNAQELAAALQQALPAYAAEQGLVFNPAAAGQQMSAGAYGSRGLFYAPTGSPGSPEQWAMFQQNPQAYLNTVLGDLAARGVYYNPNQGGPPELNYGASVPLGTLVEKPAVSPDRPLSFAEAVKYALGSVGPDVNDWRSVAEFQRNAIAEAQRIAAEEQARLAAIEQRSTAVRDFALSGGGFQVRDEHGNPYEGQWYHPDFGVIDYNRLAEMGVVQFAKGGSVKSAQNALTLLRDLYDANMREASNQRPLMLRRDPSGPRGTFTDRALRHLRRGDLESRFEADVDMEIDPFEDFERDAEGNFIYHGPPIPPDLSFGGPGYFDGPPPNMEGFARGGIVELAGGGKLAIGPGGGLDDLIPTSINGRQAAALSDGEFVIPADVVSMMGDGSSNAGARRLYDLVRQIRQAKTGTQEQASPLPVAQLLERTLS